MAEILHSCQTLHVSPHLLDPENTGFEVGMHVGWDASSSEHSFTPRGNLVSLIHLPACFWAVETHMQNCRQTVTQAPGQTGDL